ncbi:MAG TPA: hypothetical protein DHW22_11385 [Planctomycetaceae bacterium]|nr:hypothetical protein [Planctomycetaceae bacterium]
MIQGWDLRCSISIHFRNPFYQATFWGIDKRINFLTSVFIGPNMLIQQVLEYPTTIPEPTSWLLTVVGLAVYGMKRR